MKPHITLYFFSRSSISPVIVPKASWYCSSGKKLTVSIRMRQSRQGNRDGCCACVNCTIDRSMCHGP